LGQSRRFLQIEVEALLHIQAERTVRADMAPCRRPKVADLYLTRQQQPESLGDAGFIDIASTKNPVGLDVCAET
jgi:hypothetical protein